MVPDKSLTKRGEKQRFSPLLRFLYGE